MPVISPRRSSTSGSSSLYGTTSSGTGASSGIGSSSYSSGSTYLDRASSLSKTTSSNYSPSYNYLSSYSTYTPRIPAYRSSASSSSYLSGGSSTLGTYRTSSTYLGASSNDSTSSSRYGLNRKPKPSDSVKNDKDTNTGTNAKKGDSKRPPSGSDSKRLSGSYSSSSLARYVATSALDLYEKYSPAHYKPNCELSCSRSSITDAVADEDIAISNNSTNINNNSSNNNNHATTSVTLERPRNRYSRLYGDIGNKYDGDTVDNAGVSNYKRSSYRGSGKLVNSSSTGSIGISASGSSGDIPSATFTLRVNNLAKSKDNLSDADHEGNAVLKNGTSEAVTVNGIDQLKELKLNDVDTQKNDVNSDDASPSSVTIRTKLINNHSITNDDIENNKNDNNNNEYNLKKETSNSIDDVHGNSDDGSVSTTATIRLDGQSPKSSKVRSTSYRSTLPPPSPTTSSRYWDRDNVRTSSSLSTTGNSTYNSTSNDADASKSVDEKSEGLCGLRNIGNTCFMNSVIQCLSHTSELTKFLRTHNPVRSTPNKDQQILNEYSKLIRDMWTNNVRSVTPMDLKRAFSTKHRMYSDYSQQDAQEFLRFFLDALHCALNTGVKGEHLKIDDNLSDNKKADLTWEWYTRHENSLIRDLFVGQLKSTLRCTTCGNTSVTFDPFWDLSVPLPSSSRCKLDACLDLFIREENLDGDEMPTCSRCKTRRKCTKSFTIQRFPKILVIHLKRFSETRWSKMSNIVEFPTGERDLNMGPYGSNPNTNMYYSLYAISNHMGSTAGGHYVALCKHPISRKWHEFNDNIVSDTLSENHLVSSSAYILFYERA